MAPFLFALALLAQDAAPTPPAASDGPMSTVSARKQDVAPLPIQGGPVTPPSDDYGYVAWCYGAVSGYVDLYDKAMPEVIRIERAWPTPSTEENIKEVYPEQKRKAEQDIALFKRAIEAAEKASPTPIAQQGAAALKKGRGVWTGAASVPKAQLAQFWMSWSPPVKCEETAKALEARSTLFGQALTSNEAIAAPSKPAAKPAEAAPAEEAATSLAATPEPEPAEVAEAAKVAEAVTGATTDDAESSAATVDEAGADSATADEAVTDEAGAIGESAAEDATNGESVAADAPDAATEDAPPAAEGGSAIDDLLPTGEAEAAPAEEAAPEEAAPAPEPAPKPARKPGLKDTLKGLRGQD